MARSRPEPARSRTTESIDERRLHIGEAVWRVVRRDGINAVSSRSVAAESGMALGSLRHYFPRQADVIEFAMRLVIHRTTARIRLMDEDATGEDARVTGTDTRAGLLLEQFLPLDQERRAEAEVWLAFSAAALSDHSLASVKREFDALLLERIRTVLDGRLPPTASAEQREDSVARLHAVIDGLTAHLIGPNPPLDEARARSLLAAEIRDPGRTL